MATRLALTFVLLLAAQLHAAELLPSTADASRIEREHDSVPIPKASRSGPMLESPLERGPASGTDLPLTLRSVHIVGARAIPQEKLDRLYRPLLGAQVTVGRVTELAERITRFYHDEGYILAQASLVGDQSLDPSAADVTIQVTEGYIDQIKYADSGYASGPRGALIRGYLSKIPRSCRHGQRGAAQAPCPIH